MADSTLRRRNVSAEDTVQDSLKKETTATKKDDTKKKTAPRSQLSLFLSNHQDWITPTILTLLSFVTRLYRISYGNFVVWDEAHFGKFGSFYLNRTFYFDVHPPLGKLLVGLSGLLAGYDGSFDFKSGATYPESVNYPAMRLFLAIFGALLVPLAYGTAIELGFSKRGAFFAGLLVLCENSLLVISRFILLDSMLLFFTALSVYGLAGFHSERHQPFSFDWWAWLLFSGVSIGLVSSVKWVGLFSVALLGLYTLGDLFVKFGDTKMPIRTYAKHWIARIIGLILVPIIIYAFSFALHFAVLNRSGDGDAQMSSLFQAGLKGSELLDNPLEVAYGSSVTLKPSTYGVGLLHSHVQRFPIGSQQQQVTTYAHKDENNYWVIEHNWNKTHERVNAGLTYSEGPIDFVQDGDIIRLSHKATKANLHVNNLPAPVTKTALEVTGFNDDKNGDIYDEWRVEIINDLYQSNPTQVHALTTRFHLRSVQFNCLLRAHNKNLPEWGFKQGEVVCDKENDLKDISNIWNVEWHRNERLPVAPPSSFRPSFFHNFVHLNIAMWTSNNALVPDDSRFDRATSRAWEWPWMLVGMRMAGWGSESIKYLLLGNPAVWWGSTLCIILITALLVNMTISYLVVSYCWWLVPPLCPFFIMGRVLYMHHYLPALYISTLGVPFVVDHFTRRSTVKTQRIVYSVLVVVVIGTFAYFAPLTFGYNRPIEDMSGRAWLRNWKVLDYSALVD
ncbi:Dolichyl-phosphate-mannose-protein mannosyltransferase-domain-containing protein [Syncephalis fuscata]|nr:Dolichyl-phosphate-mannose-protein mannosyltransferase-domain-containing protein [Syncephalis fuscata]